MTIANAEMAAAWDGEEGAHWAENADRYESAGLRQWARLADAGLIAEHDQVLDIGCGTGRSTRAAAQLASLGSALGVDLSSRMLEQARERSLAEGIPNARFEQADAQVHPFDEEAFDIAISSFGAMFFADPHAAFSNIARAVRPGGRLALLAWRELPRNEWVRTFLEAVAAGRELPVPPPDAPTPFSLAGVERTTGILDGAGFDSVNFEPIDEPVMFGRDADDAYAFISTTGVVRGMTESLDEATRAQALANLRKALAAHESADGVLLGSSAWLITARRR
ncbi:MAG TPA: methyltransferase domain-containing protein [Acidimicrobiales bacterium]|nr:methyltransferase domain-containing protein [Acidimicrobiales bacterium]